MLALVTGASRGIGKAIAIELAKHQFQLILSARNAGNLEATASEIAAHYPSVPAPLTFAADLSKKEEVLALAAFVRSKTSSLEVLVNNAGSFVGGTISNEPDGSLEELLALNLNSAYYLTRELLPLIKGGKKPHIFNMCSIASIMAYTSGASYTISKFALLGFSKVLRAELKDQNIRVTALLPGATYTDSWKGSGLEEGRFVPAEDIARALSGAYLMDARTVVEEILIRPQLGDI